MPYENTYRGPQPGFGYVRTLSQREELPLLRDHLLRLDPESRHDRFHGIIDDNFIERYAARCAGDGTLVVAYMESGIVRGRPNCIRRSNPTTACPRSPSAWSGACAGRASAASCSAD